jgi:hypothetical protein
MIGLWVDVFNVAGTRLGDGPVSKIMSAEVNRQLDGAGTFTIRAPVSARSIALFTNENRVKIYGEDAAGVRLLGQGIIETANITESTPGVFLRVSGPDILDELTRKNTLRARIFNQQTIQTVADALIALVSGWSVQVDAEIASNLVDARYDGASVLKAFRDLVGRYGYHFRLSTDDKVISISQFGEDSGLRVFKTQVITPAMIRNPELLFVQKLPQTTETNNLANWIIPLGAGEGVGQLTLETSTRTSPYTIQNMAGPDGTLQYYLSDAASVAAYGQIETIKMFKQIAALTNSDGDIENAANALYDAAAEWLIRNKDPVVLYGLTVKNAKENILPGDKIHVNYVGQIRTPQGELVDYLNIRDDFWVMRAVERVGLEEHSVDLEISNVDQRASNVVEQVADSIESITLRDLKPEISSTVRSYVYDREIASGFTAIIPIEFTDATLQLQRVRLRLKTSPFRATATAAEGQTSDSGTFHEHVMFTYQGGANPVTEVLYTVRTSTGNPFARLKGPTQDIWTEQDRSTHTHDIPQADLVYGIADDTISPKNVTVWVNGVDKTTELFGFTPLAPAGANLDVVADVGVLSNLISGASGGLRQEHTIEIKCANQQGRVEAIIEIFEITQSVNIL